MAIAYLCSQRLPKDPSNRVPFEVEDCSRPEKCSTGFCRFQWTVLPRKVDTYLSRDQFKTGCLFAPLLLLRRTNMLIDDLQCPQVSSTVKSVANKQKPLCKWDPRHRIQNWDCFKLSFRSHHLVIATLPLQTLQLVKRIYSPSNQSQNIPRIAAFWGNPSLLQVPAWVVCISTRCWWLRWCWLTENHHSPITTIHQSWTHGPR